MITAITPTGDRHLALCLCRKWVEQQTVPIDQWLVVDDGQQDFNPGGCQYIRREPQMTDPKHTLNLNILTALPYVQGEKVLIIEDDEYYAPAYVAAMAQRLDRARIVGMGWSRYYHLPSRGYSRHANVQHASWAQTGFRIECLDAVTRCARQINQDYLDVRVWRNFGGGITAGSNLPPGWEKPVGTGGLVFHDDPPLYVGIKGLPGRAGIGVGHRSGTYRNKDADSSVLKRWIPNGDWKVYGGMTS